MSITVKQEMDFEDLMNNCWRGAFNTLQRVEEEGKEEELIDYLEDIFLEDIFYGSIPTITKVNDILWFEYEEIFKSLGIIEEEE